MANNTTPPKEIYVGNEYIEIIQGKMRSREFASTERIYDEQIKYLSEQSVLEMLAEKDRRINTLLERIKFRDDQIDIGANNILSMNADLKAKDKEIEALKILVEYYKLKQV